MYLSRYLCFLLPFLFHLASLHSTQAEVLEGEFRYSGGPVTYNLFKPTDNPATVELPLVVDLHGFGGDGGIFARRVEMNLVAEQNGFLVAYPSSPGRRSWFLNPSPLELVDTLINDVSNEYNVDATRIYVTGFSEGGSFSYAYTADRPERVAAIAPVGGTRYKNQRRDGSPWEPNFPTSDFLPGGTPETPDFPAPLLHIHGTADSVVPFEGGFAGNVAVPSVESLFHLWQENNGGTAMETIDQPDLGSNVQLSRCTDCGTYVGASGQERPLETLLYQVRDGDHSWPSFASEEIWAFFSRHELAAVHVPLLGDFNSSGTVDLEDLELLKEHFGRSDRIFRTFGRGTNNEDGFVDLADFVDLKNNFGRTAAVPEPTSGLLTAIGFLLWGFAAPKPNRNSRKHLPNIARQAAKRLKCVIYRRQPE